MISRRTINGVEEMIDRDNNLNLRFKMIEGKRGFVYITVEKAGFTVGWRVDDTSDDFRELDNEREAISLFEEYEEVIRNV